MLLNTRRYAVTLLAAPLLGCPIDPEPAPEEPVAAENIYARLGAPIPDATEEQLATFERGRQVAMRRFLPSDGLGPNANVSFCGSCHEKPVLGGSGPRYRDFYIVGEKLGDGTFIEGGVNGVLTSYGFHGADIRPGNDEGNNVSAHRNAIPFFGVGLIAELDEDAILANEDPDDADGDGISGRANYDQGFVGRFGRKAQTVSIEGFIRGPLFNHLGITTDPLPPEMQAALPVPSVASVRDEQTLGEGMDVFRQAAAPAEPLSDDDGVPDPEMSAQELFDLVSFSMLTAAPEPDPNPSAAAKAGKVRFAELGCESCHVSSLQGPRGLVPLYSDLLLHDMGEALADGIVMKVATGAEFRTQPLWGVAATGPYMHDGRADTLHEAIVVHGGEAKAAAKAYGALDSEAQHEVIAFLESLGGMDQASEGLLPARAEVPAAGTPGAPWDIEDWQEPRWIEGRRLFDRDMPVSEGLGPVFNGDSCRACHFDPVIGGAGPIDVNVMRFGTLGPDGEFVQDPRGTILHKLTTHDRPRLEHDGSHNVFEMRQTPSVLGLGLIEAIPEDDILAQADPDDANGDGISGRPNYVLGDQLGRFGWKAQVPTIAEFVRDAMTAELGVTVPQSDELLYGATEDDDDIPDPEISAEQAETVGFFIAHLDYPRPKAEVPEGREVFVEIGCADCHTPEFTTADGQAVPLYSDLLLHDVAPEGSAGVPDFVALLLEFRTPPLWGLSDTAPYMHDGLAETVEAAILAHAGEADASRDAFENLSSDDADALLAFLESL
ncbi:MAG: di-heme oxidoredictase family protein [Nannocystaceae bacterium]|nr:c-type cytochrome [bacterium]